MSSTGNNTINMLKLITHKQSAHTTWSWLPLCLTSQSNGFCTSILLLYISVVQVCKNG